MSSKRWAAQAKRRRNTARRGLVARQSEPKRASFTRPTPQQVWEAIVRAELTRLGHDPSGVEARVEGFGQDFAEWEADPVGYAHEVLQNFNEAAGHRPCPCGCCGPDDDCTCDDECCDCNEEDPS